MLERRPAVAWLEVHPENYLGGGPARRVLERLRADHPVSFHAVGLSLGSADGIDESHLTRLVELAATIEPAAISEHLAWSRSGGVYLADLLPLPLNPETLEIVATNVKKVQDRLGRRLLVENPSAYLAFTDTTMPEPEFLAELARRTGCGLLLDLNNLHVSAVNLGWDASGALAHYPPEWVGEFHLAGHTVKDVDGSALLIDDHGSAPPAPVWELYEQALALIGPRPTLIEWDTRLPELSVLIAEAHEVDALLLHSARAAE